MFSIQQQQILSLALILATLFHLIVFHLILVQVFHIIKEQEHSRNNDSLHLKCDSLHLKCPEMTTNNRKETTVEGLIKIKISMSINLNNLINSSMLQERQDSKKTGQILPKFRTHSLSSSQL